VGEELQGAEAVHKSRLAGARMAGRAGPRGDPRRRLEREIDGEVDSVLKGGDGGAGECDALKIHQIKLRARVFQNRSSSKP
jgi:hypothetical protein